MNSLFLTFVQITMVFKNISLHSAAWEIKTLQNNIERLPVKCGYISLFTKMAWLLWLFSPFWPIVIHTGYGDPPPSPPPPPIYFSLPKWMMNSCRGGLNSWVCGRNPSQRRLFKWNWTSSTVLSYGAIFFSFFLVDEIERFLSSFDFDYFKSERV